MTTGKLLWTGLICCIASLIAQLFPRIAFEIGVDIGATWRLFGFGVFLIAVATMLAGASGRSGH